MLEWAILPEASQFVRPEGLGVLGRLGVSGVFLE